MEDWGYKSGGGILTPLDCDRLKILIDQYGLDHVVKTIANLCRDEAAQLRYLWMDEGVAQIWDGAALKLEKSLPFKV